MTISNCPICDAEMRYWERYPALICNDCNLKTADEDGRPISVIPSEFGWNDVGSWEALQDYGNIDDAGNVSSGRVLNVDTHNSIVQSNGPAIAVIGMESVVVVSTEDAVLVCPRDQVQRVKEIPALARKLNWEDLC